MMKFWDFRLYKVLETTVRIYENEIEDDQDPKELAWDIASNYSGSDWDIINHDIEVWEKGEE